MKNIDILYQMDGVIVTHTGELFNVLEPKIENIRIKDIAHALPLQCRYSGHCDFHYSVAQHSVWVAKNTPKNERLAALMHDASEAYLSDIARPLKKHLTSYFEIGDKLMRLIAEKYKFEYPMTDNVRKADDKALEWEFVNMVINKPKSLFKLRHKKSQKKAEKEFLKLFYELVSKDNHGI